VRLLALFDVDGTLFLTDDPLSGQALRETLADHFRVSLPAEPLRLVDHRGQTALAIAREVLHAAGIADDLIDRELSAWCGSFTEGYLDLLAGADTSRWQAAPGADAGLSRLERGGVRLALLTGNPEPVARARLERLGLAGFFAPGQGAFGCEAEERGELIALARERADGSTREHTVAVGDTRRDIQSAHESGIRSIAVRSGRAAEPLAEADAVCDDLDAVATTLLAWAG
jgi:phosphoglycolate phosphatase-like HAD superfamily hydrolase